MAIPNQPCPEGREQIRRKEAQENAKKKLEFSERLVNCEFSL